MRIEDKGTYRVITCEFGYLIHNKKTDTYSSKIYLGKNTSLDDFEEIKDENIDKKLAEKMNELQENTEILNNINDEQDSIIIESATQIAIIQLTL